MSAPLPKYLQFTHSVWQYRKGRINVPPWHCAENYGGATQRAERACRQVLLVPGKCQETANAAASHFEWREGIFAMPHWTAAGLGGLPWQVWEAHLTLAVMSSQLLKSSFANTVLVGNQKIFYTFALWYCISSYCQLSSTAIWQQADRKHFFPVLTGRGSACWPSCCSWTGAHCYASGQWHIQAACKESCHAMLHWAILAWTKPTVTVSWDDSARKRAGEWKSVGNESLQDKYWSHTGIS